MHTCALTSTIILIYARRETSGLAKTPELVLPFGGGRRACVGRRLAEQSILAAVARILPAAELQWATSEKEEAARPLDCKSLPINKPDRPINFKITPL